MKYCNVKKCQKAKIQLKGVKLLNTSCNFLGQNYIIRCKYNALDSEGASCWPIVQI